MKSIDSFRPPTRKPASSLSTPRQEPQGSGARFTKLTTRKRKRSIPWGLIWSVLASPLLFGLAMLGMVGVAIAVVYGIIALAVRWPSRNTFVLALVALLYMVGVQLAAAKSLAQGLAVLVYILLAIGAISLAREVKSASRLWFKKH